MDSLVFHVPESVGKLFYSLDAKAMQRLESIPPNFEAEKPIRFQAGPDAPNGVSLEQLFLISHFFNVLEMSFCSDWEISKDAQWEALENALSLYNGYPIFYWTVQSADASSKGGKLLRVHALAALRSVHSRATEVLLEFAESFKLDGSVIGKSALICQEFFNSASCKSLSISWTRCLVERPGIVPKEDRDCVFSAEAVIMRLLAKTKLAAARNAGGGAEIRGPLEIIPRLAQPANFGDFGDLAGILPELSRVRQKVLGVLMKRPIISLQDLCKAAWRNPIQLDTAERTVHYLADDLMRLCFNRYQVSVKNGMVMLERLNVQPDKCRKRNG